MYFGGSVVGKASTIGIERYRLPLPYFSQVVEKSEIWRRFYITQI